MDNFDPTTLSDSDYSALDARHLLCPEPVMMLHNRIRTLTSGDIIKVIATDPSTERDIQRFCDFLNHPLLQFSVEAGQYTFWIQKK